MHWTLVTAYIVQEIQTNGNSSALVPPVTREDKNAAWSAYHTALAAAAISSVEVHTVIMYDEHGNVIDRDYFEHIQ